MIRRIVLSLALCLAFVSPALAQGKIAVASLGRISTQSQPGQEIEKVMQSTFGAERTELEKMNADLRKQEEEINKQAAALSEKALKERVQAFEKQGEALNTKAAAYSERLGKVQQAITRQMEEVLTTACKDFGMKNGYDLVIDDAALLYVGGNASDVTDQVIEEVNRVWQARGAKYEIPAK